MATYQIETEDGAVYEIETEDSPQDKQVDPIELAQTLQLGSGSLMPSVIPPDMANQIGQLPRMDPNQVADKIGEQAAVQGHPYIGGAIQMVPRVADMAYTVASMGGPSGIAKGLTSLGGPLKSALGMVTGPGEKSAIRASQAALSGLESRLVAQKDAMQGLGIRAAERQAAKIAEKKALGQAIGKAEKLGGFEITQTPDEFIELTKNPKALSQMSNTFRKISDTPSEVLKNSMDKKALNLVRKFAQHVREVGPTMNNTIKSNIAMGGHKATEALKGLDGTFGQVLNSWERANQQLQRLPLDKVKQKGAIQGAMRQTRLALKQTKAYYDKAIKAGASRDAVRGFLVKYGLGPALGGAVVKTVWGKGE